MLEVVYNFAYYIGPFLVLWYLKRLTKKFHEFYAVLTTIEPRVRTYGDFMESIKRNFSDHVQLEFDKMYESINKQLKANDSKMALVTRRIAEMDQRYNEAEQQLAEVRKHVVYFQGLYDTLNKIRDNEYKGE